VSELQHPDSRSFELVADLYERARPGYPQEAIDWVAGKLGLGSSSTVLDLGAGTGKLTRALIETGARVIAVEPGAAMRAELELALPDVEALRGAAEDIPLPDQSVDCVAVGQAFHWFRHDEAMPELHRVLRPGGRFVFSITHPAFEAPVPGRWVIEPADSERIEDRKGMLVDRYFDRPAVCWGPPAKPLAVGFHRPLRDYFAAVSAAGFLVSRYEEPLPLPEALRRFPRFFRDMVRLPNFLIVEAVKPSRGGGQEGSGRGRSGVMVK